MARTTAVAGLLAVALAVSFSPAHAQCSCGYEDGIMTQAPIAIDGDMADWATVLADGDNNACDAADATDRDHPVQSTGRNLIRTAATWGATYFPMWTERIGQANNTQNFIYYADIDEDGLMQPGEPVVVAKWQGNTGAVVLELYGYDAVNPAGDPMLDIDGYADGHSMAGDLTFVKAVTMPDGAGRGSTTGPSDGTQMEWTIEWAELGVAPGSAIRWHVSSTNSNPAATGLGAQVDDNVGGCGGSCSATSQYGSVGATTSGSEPGAPQYGFHQLTNTGNGTDLFDLSWAWSGDFAPTSVTFYRDLGTVGLFEPGTDTAVTDTGDLAPGATFDLIVEIGYPGLPTLGTTTVTTTATSNFVPDCAPATPLASVDVQDVVQVDPLALVKGAYRLDGTPIADGATLPSGLSVRFLIYVNNQGAIVSDASIEDALDPLFAYLPGSMRHAASVDACAPSGCTPVEEQAIFTAADGGAPLTDAVDTDAGSVAAGAVYFGDGSAANAQLDLPAGKVWAVAFTVVIQ